MPKVQYVKKDENDKMKQPTFDEIITQTLQEYANDYDSSASFVQALSIWEFLYGRNCRQCNKKIPKTYARLKQQGVCSTRCLKLKQLKVLK